MVQVGHIWFISLDMIVFVMACDSFQEIVPDGKSSVGFWERFYLQIKRDSRFEMFLFLTGCQFSACETYSFAIINHERRCYQHMGMMRQIDGKSLVFNEMTE